MKTIIAGGRNITNPKVVSRAIKSAIASGLEVTEVVTGGAKGVDSIAHRMAVAGGIETKPFPADWDTHGKAAGPIRNRQMAEYADALIAVWDGESRGTGNMIDEAKARGLEVFVYIVEPDTPKKREIPVGL